MLDKQISTIFDSITNQWDKNTIQISIKETLLQKRKRVSSEEEYFTSLCQNIAYLTETSFPIKRVLESCLQKKFFWDAANAEAFIADSQNVIKEEMESFLAEYKRKLTKNTLYESIKDAEFAYAYAKLRNDMEVDFLFSFLHPNNRSFMDSFLNCDPDEFFTTVNKICDAYANLFIQSMEDLFVYKNQEMKEQAATREEVKKQNTKNKGLFARLFGK
ncbi:hypothetical protein [Neobacillus mesonae]|uniref:hypothetical protein n=1 Tax=Neobacillus mesonae TaxID=1193713 RepID=UPI002040F5F2|nr:hypothetical protein [Neobacillus mesonae]MCM3568981.1 hypothetical protein [Neobacillus mesonae]